MSNEEKIMLHKGQKKHHLEKFYLDNKTSTPADALRKFDGISLGYASEVRSRIVKRGDLKKIQSDYHNKDKINRAKWVVVNRKDLNISEMAMFAEVSLSTIRKARKAIEAGEFIDDDILANPEQLRIGQFYKTRDFHWPVFHNNKQIFTSLANIL